MLLGKLGCCHCAKVHSINVKGIHVLVEWGNCNVKASGKNNLTGTLRKKVKSFLLLKAHDICVKQLHNCENDAITKCVDAMNKTYCM